MNFKRTIAWLLGIVSVIGLIVPVLVEAQENFVRITRKDAGFSISIPKDWKQRSDIPQASVFATSASMENVIVVRESLPQRVGLNEYAEMTMQNTELNVSDFKVIKDAPFVMDGRRGKRIVYSFTNKKVMYRSIAYINVKQYNGYVVTCGARQENFKQFEPVFDAIARSFKFL